MVRHGKRRAKPAAAPPASPPSASAGAADLAGSTGGSAATGAGLVGHRSRQYESYAALIEPAIGLVAQEPARPNPKDRSDLGPGMRSFAVAIAAKRRGASAHILSYVPDHLTREGILIVRVLHRSMEPRVQLRGAQD